MDEDWTSTQHHRSGTTTLVEREMIPVIENVDANAELERLMSQLLETTEQYDADSRVVHHQ
jgi:hypothetical protein